MFDSYNERVKVCLFLRMLRGGIRFQTLNESMMS